MSRLGITQDDLTALAGEPRSSGEPFMPHAEFEKQRDQDGKSRYSDPTDCAGMLRVEDSSGPLWIAVCDACGFDVGVQMQKLDPGRLAEHRLSKAGLPPEFVGKEFDKDDAAQAETLQACRMWIRAFKPSKLPDAIPAVALWGKAGRGKTHLLSLIIETLIRTHSIDALYRSSVELLDELQAGFDEGNFELRWQRVLRVPVLALDDLGAGRASEWRQDRFAALVDYRYSHGLPLLVATNIPPAGWEKKFGERTTSRLRGMCLRFELAGGDRRENRQQTLEGAS